MTYAIIETGGKQLKVEPGRFYDVERLSVEDNDQITLDQVLFIEHDGEATIGQPLIAEATVEATVMRHLRGRKIIVYKMRPKKKTRKKQGHRQELTRLMINSISLNGDLLAGASLESGTSLLEEAAPILDTPIEEPAVEETVAVEAVEEPAVEETVAVEAVEESIETSVLLEAEIETPVGDTTDEEIPASSSAESEEE